MKKTRSDRFEPAVYLPSKFHPEYQASEQEYVIKNRTQKLLKKGHFAFPPDERDPFLGLAEPRALASSYQHEIELARIDSD